MKHSVRYENGQSLSFTDYGDRNGAPILVQHGLIASITDANLFHHLLDAGRRIVCIARPGYGESSPYSMRNIAEWGNIVSVLVETLKLSEFDVLGISSGAPYSYAIGYRLPNRVRTIYIFSGIPALYDDQIISCWPYPVDKGASIPDLERLVKTLFFSSLSADDLQRDDIKDSMNNNGFGLAQDFKLRCSDWGFRLSDIHPFVYMQHSREDNFVTAEMTARLLPNCRFDIRAHGEHFSSAALDDFIKTAILSA